MIAMEFPKAQSRSPSPTLSDTSDSPLQLDPQTLAVLDSFISSRADQELRFSKLARQASVQVAGLDLDRKVDDEENTNVMMDVDDFRAAFGEDWQLSQFWYTTRFALRLARSVHELCEPSSVVAFVCCPTGFVAFQHVRPSKGVVLLEYDQRFAVLAQRKYIFYDLEEPDGFPEELRENVDVAIVDPPFLNEVTNKNLEKTLRQILHPTRGKLIIVTSTSVEPVLHEVYAEAPLGPLHKSMLEVEHGQLKNNFACWGSWPGAKDFGKDSGAEIM
jgi:hypothetical protein